MMYHLPFVLLQYIYYFHLYFIPVTLTFLVAQMFLFCGAVHTFTHSILLCLVTYFLLRLSGLPFIFYFILPKLICVSSWHAQYIVNNSLLTVYIQPACPHFRQATLVFISWLTSRESHAWLLPLMEVFNLLHKGDSSRHYTTEISCFFDIRSFHHLYCL